MASAKRALSGNQQAIFLHDTLRREFNRIATLPVNSTGPWTVTDGSAEHGRRLKVLEAETELLLALVATVAYWGSEETDRWWVRDIEPLGTQPGGGGNAALIDLARAPATMVIYVAGIAALAAERWSTLVRVLTEPQAEHAAFGLLPAAAVLGPQHTIRLVNASSSEHLHRKLRPVFTEHLALSVAAYTEAWERFEYLRMIVQHHAGQGIDWLHVHRTGVFNTYRPAPSAWLDQEIGRLGGRHPLVEAGLLGGDVDRLKTAKGAADAEFNRWASQMGWR